jgi:hypothetical protein
MIVIADTGPVNYLILIQEIHILPAPMTGFLFRLPYARN